MEINLDKYTPVSVSATCTACRSTSVKQEQSKGGRPYLVEIFIMGGEEVSARNDFHSKYCPKDRSLKNMDEDAARAYAAGRKEGRQDEIRLAYIVELEKLGIDEDEPKVTLPDPEPTPAPAPEPEPIAPVEEPIPYLGSEPGEGIGAQLGYALAFVNISERIDEILSNPDHVLSDISMNELQTLYYRLYNEIPATGRRR